MVQAVQIFLSSALDTVVLWSSVEELGEVPGIGAKRLATLTPLVTV